MSGLAQSGVIIALLVAALVAAGYFSPPSVRTTAKRWISFLMGASVVVYWIVTQADLVWRVFHAWRDAHDKTVIQNVVPWLVIAVAVMFLGGLVKSIYSGFSRPKESRTQS